MSSQRLQQTHGHAAHALLHRSPSTVHAIIVSFLCFYALCYSGDFFDTGLSTSSNSSIPAVFKVSELSYSIIGISFGYFLMDAAVLTWWPEIGSTEMFIHHAVALLSLVVAAQVHCMHVYLLMVMLSEVTTPSVSSCSSRAVAGQVSSLLDAVIYCGPCLS